MKHTCKVCNVFNQNRQHTFFEMMFGSRDEFDYFECLNCGSLQIAEVPLDLGRHYPSDYLGVATADSNSPPESVGMLRKLLRIQRSSYLMGRPNYLGWVVTKLGPNYFPYPWNWLKNTKITPTSEILDVGCGPGSLLDALHRQGFSRAVGQDIFQKWTLPGVTIFRKPLAALSGQYDLIMLHHSFEHMPDPLVTLMQLKKLCNPKGTILIRIPVAGCLAWRIYGGDWFQIDAPRHLVIPSEKGMKLLARQAGLELRKIDFDSTADQFSCSEQYRLGIPLKDPHSSFQRLHDSKLFTDEQKKSFADLAKRANDTGEGDQACFYLTPT